jgi:asparagine synthase (glutamine-hydrolysing)
MCGIVGYAGKLDCPRLQDGLNVLNHRGPDEAGLFEQPSIALGIRRLSIVDLTEGVQPVRSETGEVVAVMNGEIYNHVELAEGLRSRGHSLRSRTDAEVLPHLYEEHGDAFVEHLRGMFAVALWDGRKQRLVLARDRFGKKPLYFRQPSANSLAFASELKALKALLPNAKWSVREQGVYDFLSLGCVPQPETIFQDVQQVPPASVLIFDGGKITTRKFQSGHNGNAHGTVRKHIRESVRLRLRSDVPVGVFLSGGVDSTIVAIEAAKEVGESLRTFTVKMDDPALDESEVAADTARALGVRHEVLPLEISPREDLLSVVRHYDQPFADSSALPSWAVARAAAQHVKVVLNGDGGDELFAGYRRHLAAFQLGRVGCVPRFLWKAVAALPAGGRRSRMGFLRRFARGAGSAAGRRYLEWSNDLLLETDKQRHWRGGAMRSTEEWVAAQMDPGLSPLRQQMHLDCRINLLSDLLVKMDMATMAHSLEARSPLLDQELAEFAAGIPDAELLRGGQTKSFLRNAYADELPAAVLAAPKRGFEAPVARWLAEDWRELLHDSLAPGARAEQFVSRRFLQDLLADRVAGDRNLPMLKYTLLVLELWLREQEN